MCLVSGSLQSLELVLRCRSTPPSIRRLLSSSAARVRGRAVRSRLSMLLSARCFSCSKLSSRESERECTLKSREPLRECASRGMSREAERGKASRRESRDSRESLRTARLRSGSSSECWRARGSSWMVLESLRR